MIFASCVSSPRGDFSDFSDFSGELGYFKEINDQDKNQIDHDNKQEAAFQYSHDLALKFYQRWNKPSYFMTLKIKNFLTWLTRASAEKNILVSALKSLGTLHLYRNNQSEDSTLGPKIVELSIDHKRQNPLVPTDNLVLTLEQLSLQNNVDLLQELKNNIYLNNVQSQWIAFNVVQLAPESTLSSGILAIVRKNQEKWLLFKNSTADMSEGLSLINKESEGLQSSILPALPFEYGELNGSSKLIQNAQEFMNQNKFLEAVKLLESLSIDSLLYDSAREKITVASNLGVQILRKKLLNLFKVQFQLQT